MDDVANVGAFAERGYAEHVISKGMRVIALASVLVAASIAACSSSDSSGLMTSHGSDGGPGTTDDGSTPIGTNDAGTGTVLDSGTSAPDADPCSGRKICDSFESGSLGTTWTKQTNNGTVEVSTTRAFTGTHAVKVSTNGTQYQQAYLVNAGAPLFPLTTNIMYGRMMVYLETPIGKNVHWTIISGNGPVAGQGTDAFYRYGGQTPQNGTDPLFLANYDTTNKQTDCYQHSASKMPYNKWTCFAWTFDGTKDTLKLNEDGKDLTDMTVVEKGEGCINNDLGGKWLAPTFSSTTLGWESYQQDVGHTMYIDDVILDSAPVSCP